MSTRSRTRLALTAFVVISIGLEGWAPGMPRAFASDSSPSGSSTPEIRWISGAGRAVVVEVLGTDPRVLQALSRAELSRERWSACFSVVVLEKSKASDATRLPILGRYHVDADKIRFEPRFPLEPGLTYRARFDPGQLHSTARTLVGGGTLSENSLEHARPIVADYQAPSPGPRASTVVTQVYPTGDQLPENLLRFYIHFSAPMSRGEVYDRVRLLDASGRPVRGAFLELAEELWDPNQTRLTLLFDPGRIKSGLKPREELGPILELGKTYTLAIDRDWPDAQGNPLRESYRKTFRATSTDSTQPNPRTWTIRPPTASTREPVVLVFPEPLDHAVLGRSITVLDARGKTVPGQFAIDLSETRWQFTPERDWQAGAHTLSVDTSLEDLVGNSISQPFEVDVFKKVEASAHTETIALPFEPKAMAAPEVKRRPSPHD